MKILPKIPRSVFEESDEFLPHNLHDAISEHMHSLRGDSFSGIDTLPIKHRACYTTAYLSYQMTMAGFHAYFTNSRGQLDPYMLGDLREIGAVGHAEVYDAAFSIYKMHDYQSQWANIGKSWEIYQAGFADERFRAVEARYDSISPKLDEIITSYIKQNIKALTRG